MLTIGLTGGIGSGKSTIAMAFEALGAPLYNADRSAKMLMESEPSVIDGLKQIFGSDIYDECGKLRRRRMAELIFNDKSLLAKVEGIVHPAVYRHFAQWARELGQKGMSYAIFEAAIIIEGGHAKDFDQVWLATAPDEMRIERTMLRDNCSREQVVERMRNQLPDAEKRKFATEIFLTDDRHRVLQQIIDLDKKLRC